MTEVIVPSNNAGVDNHAFLQGNLPEPGTEPGSPALQADSLPSEPPGKAMKAAWAVIFALLPILSRSHWDL